MVQNDLYVMYQKELVAWVYYVVFGYSHVWVP